MTTKTKAKKRRGGSITFKGDAANLFAASMFRHFGDEETAKRLEANVKPAAAPSPGHDADGKGPTT